MKKVYFGIGLGYAALLCLPMIAEKWFTQTESTLTLLAIPGLTVSAVVITLLLAAIAWETGYRTVNAVRSR